MKRKYVLCRPTARDNRHACRYSKRDHKLWKKTPFFNLNPRGQLIHRSRLVITHSRCGRYSHESVTHWCGNSTSGDGVELSSEFPEGRLLCARCEKIAVEAGELPVEKLVGHHVHIGVLRPHRLCCRNDQN